MGEPIASILQQKGPGVWSIDPAATVYEAIEMMADRGIGALLVISPRRLEGIITERDYARKVILQGRSSKDTRVRDIMTTRLITVTPEHTVDGCMRIMTENRIRHLPVLEEGRVAGILSIGDLVNAVISAQKEMIDHLHTYIGVKYPG